MKTGAKVTTVVIAMTIAAVFIGPLVSVIGAQSGTVGVGNEEATIYTDEWTDLEGFDITANFTLETTDGTTLSEGTDYELNQTAGTITAKDGSSSVSDGDTVVATYEYQATDGTTTTIVNLVPLFAALLILGTAAVAIQNRM